MRRCPPSPVHRRHAPPRARADRPVDVRAAPTVGLPRARLDAAVHAGAARGRQAAPGAGDARRRRRRWRRCSPAWATRCRRSASTPSASHGRRGDIFGSREFFAGDHLTAARRRVPRDPRQRRRGVPRRRLPGRRERPALRRRAPLPDHVRRRSACRRSTRSGRSPSTTRTGCSTPTTDRPLCHRQPPPRRDATRPTTAALTIDVQHQPPAADRIRTGCRARPDPSGSPSAPTCHGSAIRDGAWTRPARPYRIREEAR